IWIPKMIKKRVCTTFVEDSSSNGALCQCGGARDIHAPISAGDHVISQWDSEEHTSEYPTDAFGQLEFAGAGRRNSPFLRLAHDTPPDNVYSLMTSQWGLPIPNLVVSVVGGEGKEKVKPRVREVIRQGLVRAAQSTGAWIMTSGLREGVGRCVGEAVRDHCATASSLSQAKVIAVGVAPWGLIYQRQQLVNPQGSFPARYYVHNMPHECSCLDNNHQAFLLIDDGSVGHRGTETMFRANLEDFISHQRTGSGSIEIPVLCVLIAGDAAMLERVDLSLKNTTPWLVLAGSGPAADLIAAILKDLNIPLSPPVSPTLATTAEESRKSASVELRDLVREKIKKHFPSEAELEKLVDQALSIYHNRDLITVFHGDQEGRDDFDRIILRALVRAAKRDANDPSEYTEELKLAVAWDRVDIAKSELFNGDIHWRYEDLEESMTDALVNDKPHFVRLFVENGLNILDYLTYHRLESLYSSLSDCNLVSSFLQRRLQERVGLAGSQARLVSRVLSEIMEDVCQPFYYAPLGVEQGWASRKAMKVPSVYRKQRCMTPWIALFIWAVLQNRREMSIYFWEMAGESVLSALAGCKILRELSKLETETETKLCMKELAQTFENLAHDVFSECYQSNESRSFKLLIRQSPVWGSATCLQMATAADARLFFSHDGVQTLLSEIWWGDMDSNTEVWKLVLSFFLPPFVYTNLISFKSVSNNFDTDKIKQVIHVLHREDDVEECNALRGKPEGAITLKRPFILHRWRQFWFAPVTSFLGNVLMYFLFLFLFAYVLLVDFKPPPPDGPAPSELVLYFWVFTLVCEEIRQTFFVGSTTVIQRMKLYIQDIWNKCDITALALFILGLLCRMFPWTYNFGRAVMCVDYVVFTLRLIHIFAVHKQLGPKIIIVGKMVKDVFFFLFFLGVWLMAYGVANQALLYSYDSRPGWVIRRVFYRPYMHIYGQIPLDEIDGRHEKECTDNVTLIHQGAEPCPQSEANWLVLILLSVYLLVTNILLVNLLIAMFSYTFNKVQEHSDVHWKFQRYNLIAEYHSRPCLSPPFIIISHLHIFIKRVIQRLPSNKSQHFMLDLKGKEASLLNTWESTLKENLLSTQGKKQRESDTERLKRTSTKSVNPQLISHTSHVSSKKDE
uniref:Transient receptor potential cation channel, subfamily M, member 4a n=1 Tax=Cyprinus carpio TaxID=7962 RepID=A0A8C1WI09_CYPCA